MLHYVGGNVTYCDTTFQSKGVPTSSRVGRSYTNSYKPLNTKFHNMLNYHLQTIRSQKTRIPSKCCWNSKRTHSM